MNELIISKNLIDDITSSRLLAYNGNFDLYVYNLKIAESLYPALSLLEVTLRNRMDKAIQTLIEKDWLLKELNSQKLLSDKEYKKLKAVEQSLIKSKQQITNDKLVSEMTLGFWVHLFTKSYKLKFWDKKGFFELVFPNYESNKKLRKISDVYNDLNLILRLRNRVFHHERIINKKIDIEIQYKIITKLIYLLSKDMLNLLNQISNFEKLAKQKP